MNKKVTMLELAKIARVDISTVSRALNDSPVVKESTRKRIQRIASEIGYAVNARQVETAGCSTKHPKRMLAPPARRSRGERHGIELSRNSW